MKIDWMTTILTIVGALIGQMRSPPNITFLGDLIPIAGTSVGALLIDHRVRRYRRGHRRAPWEGRSAATA